LQIRVLLNIHKILSSHQTFNERFFFEFVSDEFEIFNKEIILNNQKLGLKKSLLDYFTATYFSTPAIPPSFMLRLQ
jgi:hypothetical protein